MINPNIQEEITNALKALMHFPAAPKNLMVPALAYDACYAVFKPYNLAFNETVFWQHSLAVANTAQLLAMQKSYHDPSKAFLAGLLHDIGKLLLAQNCPPVFAKIALLTEQKCLRMAEVEQIILGLTHAQIGEWLGQAWQLPAEVTQAIAFHHHPNQNEHDLPKLIEAANVLVYAIGLAPFGQTNVPPLSHSTWQYLDFTEADLQIIFSKIASV